MDENKINELLKTSMEMFHKLAERFNLREKMNDDNKYCEMIYKLSDSYVRNCINFTYIDFDVEKANDDFYLSRKTMTACEAATNIAYNDLEKIVKELV